MNLMKWKNHEIENIEISILLNGLKERYGYDFSGYAKASLKRRLMEIKRYFEINHLSELIPEMLYNDSLAQTIINKITNPTSEFFRDDIVWEFIRNSVLPWLSSFPKINIWQIGCGKGEETYSLSILLHETDLLKKTHIITSDINPLFLKDANKGTWSKQNFNLWKQNYKNSGGIKLFEDYFNHEDEIISIKNEFKQSIEFIEHNLVTDGVFKEVQFIMCRNVLIYFGEILQDRAIQLFSDSLERGGYILLGLSENILNLQERHPDLEELGGDIQIFRKIIRDL